MKKKKKKKKKKDCTWVKTDGIKFLVKNNNQFKCIATPTLKFLGITSYLTPLDVPTQVLGSF